MSKTYRTAIAALVFMGTSSVEVYAAPVAGPTFVDPTATFVNRDNIQLGELVYIAPFATLQAGDDDEREIDIGNESNVQDSVAISTKRGAVRIGEQVIMAHGATVKGPVAIGEQGFCGGGTAECPSFVGFNAEVDGAIIEKDAMVSALARVGRDVRIPSGRKVLPGKNITSQGQVAGKTALVTEADREFMRAVIEVNTAFAREYTRLAAEDKSNVYGINYDPGNTSFNPNRDLPTLDDEKTRDPGFRNRIIGDVRMADEREDLDDVMGFRISLRADEGEPFQVGTIDSMADRTTFHALEHTKLKLGNEGRYGYHSLVHGGPTPFADATISGDNVSVGTWAVLFRSRIGSNSTIGFKSLVQESDLPAGTNIPACTVVINNAVFGKVENCR